MLFSRDGKVLATAGAVEGVLRREQILHRRGIGLMPVSLEENSLVRNQAVGAQAGENSPDCAGGFAWRIDVLDTKQPLSSGRSG